MVFGPQGSFRVLAAASPGGVEVFDRSIGYILSAHSEDGAAWTKEPGIRLDAYGPYADGIVLCPDLIPLPDGRLRMYCSSKRAGMPDVLLSTVSENGLDWEPEPGAPFLTAGLGFSTRPVTIEEGGVY
jgi:hypothetical protein